MISVLDTGKFKLICKDYIPSSLFFISLAITCLTTSPLISSMFISVSDLYNFTKQLVF